MKNINDLTDDVKLALILLGKLDKMQAGDEWPYGAVTFCGSIYYEVPESKRPPGDDPVTRSSMIELLQEYIKLKE